VGPARVVFTALVFSLAAWPQAQSNSGDIRVSVVDQTGAALARASVTASDTERGISRSAHAGPNGDALLSLLPPGRYRLRVEAEGFTTKLLEGVEVRVGDTVSLVVEMVVSELQQQVEVLADSPVVDTERAQQASNIELSRIRELPINRRNYLDLALLTPSTSATADMVDGTDLRVAQTPQSGISFGGGNGRGNAFLIDGVENMINSGGVRLSVSQEAVQEFQVNRNTTSAEFGWASGGTLNVITRSGSNDLHGNVFGFLRHRAIQARNFFDPTKSSFTRSQAGTTLGGPLKKEKTFYFLAFERLDRHETSFVPILQDPGAFSRLTPSQDQLFTVLEASGVPQLAGLAKQLRAALTPALNPAVSSLFAANSGTFPFGENTNMFSARIDHRPSERHNLYFRGSVAGSKQANAQFGALIAYNRGRSFEQWDGTAMLSDTWLLCSHWVLETRLMFNYNTLFVTSTDPYGPEMNITGYGFFGRDIFLPFRNYERHYEAMQNWSHQAGAHTAKFGFDIDPVRDTVISDTFFSGRFNFGEAVPLANVIAGAAGTATVTQISGFLAAAGQSALAANLQQPITALQAFSLGLPTFYQQGFGNPNWMGWSKRYGFYAQDTWKAARSFTLNYGVRYDLEVNHPVIGTDKNNFAPRVGFAWAPHSASSLTVRGGYGLYYMPTNLQVPNVADTLSGRYINQVFVPLTGITGINNPATGRPTTSADIYQGLLRAGVIGHRTITPADLLSYGVPVGPGLPLRVEFGSDPIRQGYAQQASLEIERAFGDTAVSVGWNMNHTLGIARISGRNLYYTGQFQSNGIPIYGKFDPLLLQKNIFTYDGNSLYHAAIFQVQRRLRHNLSFAAHYTFSKALDDVTDFNSDYSPMDQLNKRAERSLSAFHHAHRVVVHALFQAPAPGAGASLAGRVFGSWSVAPIFAANSWRPFNVVTGVDINNDNYVTNDRPWPAGRNIGRGPGLWSADLRISRRFPFGADAKRNVEFIAEGFNLANRTNFRTVNNTVGNVPLSSLPRPLEGIKGASPTTPLAFTSAYDPRQFQFGLKINF
jgi:hypothetical protein